MRAVAGSAQGAPILQPVDGPARIPFNRRGRFGAAMCDRAFALRQCAPAFRPAPTPRLASDSHQPSVLPPPPAWLVTATSPPPQEPGRWSNLSPRWAQPRGSQPHPPGPPPHEWGGGNVSRSALQVIDDSPQDCVEADDHLPSEPYAESATTKLLPQERLRVGRSLLHPPSAWRHELPALEVRSPTHASPSDDRFDSLRPVAHVPPPHSWGGGT